MADGKLRPTQVKTLPYPGFPTDMQAQIAAVLCLAEGTSIVTESIFENRFRYVNDLVRMGAKVRVEGNSAIITGVPSFTGIRSSCRSSVGHRSTGRRRSQRGR